MTTRRFAAGCVALVMVVSTSCERRGNDAAASPPVRDWVELTADPDPGWDEAAIALEARAELEACREVMEERLGIRVDAARSLAVRLVHGDSGYLRLLDSIAPTERVVEFWDTPTFASAFLRPDARQLVLTGVVVPVDRVYLFSLALVVAYSNLGPINLADSVATWVSGMVVSKLRGEPLWRRGRLVDGFLQTSVTQKLLEEACLWGSQPLPATLDLGMGRDPVTWIDGGGIDGPDTETSNRIRRTSWFFVWFLANFAETPERRVSFDLPPKYEATFREILAKRDPAGRKALCDALASREAMVSDCSSFMDYVRRKRNMAQVRDGVVLGWSEFTNAFGNKTGVPEDDLLK